MLMSNLKRKLIIGGIAVASAVGFLGVEDYTAYMAWEGVHIYDTDSGFLSKGEYSVIDGVYWYIDDQNFEATTTDTSLVMNKRKVDFLRKTNLAFFKTSVGNEFFVEIPISEYRRLGQKNEKMTSKKSFDPTFGGLLPIANAAISTSTITTSNSSSNVASISFSHDTGASSNDRQIIVSVTTQRNNTTSVTVGGNSATKYQNTSGRAYVFIYNPEGVLTGSQTIVVSSSNSLIYAAAYTLYGAEQTTPVEDTAEDGGTGTAPSITLTTTSGGMVFDAIYHEDNTGANSIGSGQYPTIDANPNSNQSRVHTYKESDSTSETLTSTFDSDSFYQMGLAIAPAAGGGGGGAASNAQSIIWLHGD